LLGDNCFYIDKRINKIIKGHIIEGGILIEYFPSNYTIGNQTFWSCASVNMTCDALCFKGACVEFIAS